MKLSDNWSEFTTKLDRVRPVIDTVAPQPDLADDGESL